MTSRSLRSFSGRPNYYSIFIENFAIYASVLYELRETEFSEISHMNAGTATIPKLVQKMNTALDMDQIRIGYAHS